MAQKSDDLIMPGDGRVGCRLTLSDEIVGFIESGLSIIVAVAGPDGRARTGRALAVRVMPHSTIRLIYAREGNAAITAAARSGGPIAVTLCAPVSHRTVQLKAMACKPEDVLPEDAAIAQVQTDALADTLRAVGESPGFVQAFSNYRASERLVLSFSVHEAFEQSPGPGAGRPL